MDISVIHNTKYTYESPVSYSQNIAVLKPRTFPGQQVLEYKIDISPTPNEFSERLDFFDNYITRFSIQDQHKNLEVITKSTIKREYSSIRETFFSNKCTSVTFGQALEMLDKLNAETIEVKQFL